MDKKYLYDGKTVNGGKKVRGNVLVSGDDYFIVPVFGVSCVEDGGQDGWEGDALITLHAYKVIPDTICRFCNNGKGYFS